MNKLLSVTAFGEAVFGLVLLVYPPIVARLLFNAELSGTGLVMGRVAGIALIALGVACQPGKSSAQPFWGMLTYSGLVMLYLAYIGIEGDLVGILLWPAVVLHAVLTFFLARAWQKKQRT